jgi:hypothetical protein
MLSPETLAEMLLLQLHQEGRPGVDPVTRRDGFAKLPELLKREHTVATTAAAPLPAGVVRRGATERLAYPRLSFKPKFN